MTNLLTSLGMGYSDSKSVVCENKTMRDGSLESEHGTAQNEMWTFIIRIACIHTYSVPAVELPSVTCILCASPVIFELCSKQICK